MLIRALHPITYQKSGTQVLAGIGEVLSAPKGMAKSYKPGKPSVVYVENNGQGLLVNEDMIIEADKSLDIWIDEDDMARIKNGLRFHILDMDEGSLRVNTGWAVFFQDGKYIVPAVVTFLGDWDIFDWNGDKMQAVGFKLLR